MLSEFAFFQEVRTLCKFDVNILSSNICYNIYGYNHLSSERQIYDQ